MGTAFIGAEIGLRERSINRYRDWIVVVVEVLFGMLDKVVIETIEIEFLYISIR